MLEQIFPNNFDYLPILDESVPKIPVRSRFYHLQPLGIGTPMSECLTSYICRLAAAHSVSVGNLFEYALVPKLKKDYLKTPGRLGPAAKLNSSFRNQIKNINGTGKTARDWVDILERLTLRKDLSNLTFLKMSEVLSRYYTTRKFQAWCPTCLEEMQNSGSEIYYPLLWSLLDVKVCHIHQIPLVDICSDCSRQSLPLLKKVRLGFCSRCRIWLGTSQNNSPQQSSTQFSEKEFQWNLFVSEETGKLIAFISNPTAKSFTVPPSQSIKLCVEQATNGGVTAFSSLIQTHLMTFYGWFMGRQKPRLKDILKICYCLNLTLLDFFNHPETIKTKELKIREWIGIDKKPPRPTPQPFDHNKIKTKLKKYIKIHPPLSMAQVARKIGYDRAMLGWAFPDLKNKIRSNYNEYQKFVCEVRRNKLEKEIKSAVHELEEKGEFVSTKRVARFLNKPSYEGRRDVAQIVFNTRKNGKLTKKSK